MTRILTGQTNFTAGQQSPRLNSRIDVTKYNNGVSVATNVQVTAHGPMLRRNGTKAISPVKDSSKTVRNLKFQFAENDSFNLEFGDEYIRFYKNDAIIQETAKTITGLTNANPGVVTSNGHGYTNGDHIYFSDVSGTTGLNDKVLFYTVSNKDTNTFEIKDYDGVSVNTTSSGTFASGKVSKVFEIVSPYSEEDLSGISYVQFGDLIYIAHPSYAPQVLTRTANTSWTIEPIALSPPPTYQPGEQPDVTLSAASTSGTDINFTAGSATWLDADIGRQIVNNSTGETGVAIITSITSSTIAVCDIITNFTDTSAIASGDWKLDLSPIAELNFTGTAAGSIVTVTSNRPTGFTEAKKVITGLSNGTPSVVTSNGHGYTNGDTVSITNVLGMSEINDRDPHTIKTVATNTFNLYTTAGLGFNSSTFNVYASGGAVARVLTGVLGTTFRSTDVDKFIIANDGVLKIIEYVDASTIKCEVLKSLSSSEFTNNWTIETETWTESRGYPRAIGLYEQRLVFAGTGSVPQGIWFSETGIFTGFGRGSLDSDAIDLEIASKQVNQINWISNNRDLIIGTAGSEITISAASTGSGLSASNIKQTPRRYHGSDQQTPVGIGDETIFIQQSGRKIRSFRYDFTIDGYKAEDLTFLAEDITEGIVKEMAFAAEPDNVIYAVTNTGDLLTGTYVQEQAVIGWSKYTTDGSYESVQTISEDNRDKVYVVVKRTVDGNTRRYIEVLDDSTGENRLDGFTDSYITHSEPKPITTITLADPVVVTSAGHGYANGDRVKIIKANELTGKSYLVSSTATNTFELTTLQGVDIDSTAFTAYVSGGEVHKLVNTIEGLEHLEGKTVEVKADGSAHTSVVVTDGAITLTNYHYELTIGLPYVGTITTSNKDFNIGPGPMQNQRSRHVRITLRLQKSKLPLLNDEYLPARDAQDLMNFAVPLSTGDYNYGRMEWSDNGRVTITASGPFPMQLNGIFGTLEGNVK